MTAKNVKRTSRDFSPEIDFSTEINRLEYYIRLRFQIQIVFEDSSETGLYTEGRKVSKSDFIIIDSKKPKEWQLYALLHEAGHVLLRESEEGHRARFPLVEHKRNTIGKRVDVLREETMAWERGELLALELKIDIHREKWQKQRTKALMEYIKWASDPKGYKIDQP